MMIPNTFHPYRLTDPPRSRGCFTCTNFHGNFHSGHVLCERDRTRKVIGVPSMGCAFWEREPGSDDS
jgi:hypothetical protein